MEHLSFGDMVVKKHTQKDRNLLAPTRVDFKSRRQENNPE